MKHISEFHSCSARIIKIIYFLSFFTVILTSVLIFIMLGSSDKQIRKGFSSHLGSVTNSFAIPNNICAEYTVITEYTYNSTNLCYIANCYETYILAKDNLVTVGCNTTIYAKNMECYLKDPNETSSHKLFGVIVYVLLLISLIIFCTLTSTIKFNYKLENEKSGDNDRV